MSYISNYTGPEMDARLTKGGNSIQKVEEQVVVTVGPNSADFTTINEAITFLSEHLPVYEASEKKAFIDLQPDFVMEEQVLVNDTDLGWITIRSEEGDAYSISDFQEGDPVTGSELPQISQVTIEDFSGDADQLDGQYVSLDTPNDGSHYFYFTTTTGSNDPGITGTSNEVGLSITDTPSEVATKLQAAVDSQTFFNASITGDLNTVVQITNADDGNVSETVVDGNLLSLETTQEGRDEQSETVIIFSEAHPYSAGDRVIIRDQQGGEEEVDYNGTWFVLSVPDGTRIVLDHTEDDDAYYDAVKAGASGSQSGGSKGEVVSPQNVFVSREALTEQWEFFYYPAFGVARGTLPTIGAVFQMDDSLNAREGYFSYLDGICATDSGVVNILPNFGFINADGSNVYGTRRSEINANGVIASGAGRHGIWAYSATTINARGAVVDGCGWRASSTEPVGPYEETLATGGFAPPESFTSPGFDSLGDYGESIGSGIIATRNSIINAEGCAVTNCHGPNIVSEYGSIIAVGGHTGNGTSTGCLLGSDYNFFTRGGGIISFSDDIQTAGLGTAAKVDITPSSLTGDVDGMAMKVGDFGIGEGGWNLSGGDLDALTPQRTRFFAHTEATAPSNIPLSPQRGLGFSIYGDQEDRVAFQLWTAVDEDRTFVRRQDSSGAWSDWHELWTNASAPSDDTWTEITSFENDWSFEGTNTCKYIKRLGVVTLVMNLNAATTTDDVAWILPSDYRPDGEIYATAIGFDDVPEQKLFPVVINDLGEVAIEGWATGDTDIRFTVNFPVT